MKLSYETPLLEEVTFVDGDVITSSPPTPLIPGDEIDDGENQEWQ